MSRRSDDSQPTHHPAPRCFTGSLLLVWSNRRADPHPPARQRITRVRFNALGTKLGATDAGGSLSIFHTDCDSGSIRRLTQFRSHSRYTSALLLLRTCLCRRAVLVHCSEQQH
jgi:hypothetical protein